MKVHELKEILNNYDDTADVFFSQGTALFHIMSC